MVQLQVAARGKMEAVKEVSIPSWYNYKQRGREIKSRGVLLFQFLHGTITSVKLTGDLIITPEFQFLHGTITRDAGNTITEIDNQFQFLHGTITRVF